MLVAQRDAFYASKTGLSKAAVRRYRLGPLKSFATRKQKQIARTIKECESCAKDASTSWPEWKKHVRDVLAMVRDFICDVLKSVAGFIRRVAAPLEALFRAFASGWKMLTA